MPKMPPLPLRSEMPRRADFVKLTLEQMNCPYVWGKDGQEVEVGGKKVRAFDCSGLVCWALYELTKGKYDLRNIANTDVLWDYFTPTGTPRPGDLVLYGQGAGTKYANPNHVMLWLGFADMVYGASGGNSNTVAPTSGACVKVKPTFLYRPDFLGYRSLEKVLKE